MSQVLKQIMPGLLLLKLIVIGSLISATLIVVLPYEVTAKDMVDRDAQRRQLQSGRCSTVRQCLQRDEIPKIRRSPGGKDAGSQLDTSYRDSFDLGFAFVRAMYFASLSGEEKEANDKAIVELVYLMDRLEHKPDEVVALRHALRMVVRGSGAGSDRWEAVQSAIRLHAGALRGELQWYFNSGISVARLFIATYLNDAVGIRNELQNLQTLARIAPQSLPRNVLASMQRLLGYFDQTTFTENDRAAVIQVVENILITVTA